jgi:hypothetical protein
MGVIFGEEENASRNTYLGLDAKILACNLGFKKPNAGPPITSP